MMGTDYWVDLYLRYKQPGWSRLSAPERQALLSEAHRLAFSNNRMAATHSALVMLAGLLLGTTLFCALPWLITKSVLAFPVGVFGAVLCAQWVYSAYSLRRDTAFIEQLLQQHEARLAADSP